MSSTRLVRGAKTRMFAFVCLIAVLGAVLYVFHGTQARLSEVQSQASQCGQQRDGISAQQRVLIDYKLRLEASLSKEKEERKQDNERRDKELADAREKWAKEATERNNKYDGLEQKSKILQAQLEDQKESSDKALAKLQEEAASLKAALEQMQPHLGLKDKFLAQQEKLKNCVKDVEDCQMKTAPEAEQKDYLTKQNEQLKAESEQFKMELTECRDKLTQPTKPSTASAKNDRIDAPPDSPVAALAKVMELRSSTPGINPDAVGGENSSDKPLKELPESHKDELQNGLTMKKPTQGVITFQSPKRFDDNPPPQGQAQIPEPPDANPAEAVPKPAVEDTNDLSNINLEEGEEPFHQQEANAQLQQPQSANQPVADPNKGGEEEEQAGPGPLFKQRGRNADHYRGGDYEKDQVEDDDDEAEQLDYERPAKEGRRKVRQRQGAAAKQMAERGGGDSVDG